MKKSIAGRVIINVFVMLFLIMALVCTVTYFMTQDSVRKSIGDQSEVALDMFAFSLKQASEESGIPMADGFDDVFRAYSEPVLDNFDFDYLYMFVPNSEAGTIRYVAIIGKHEEIKEKIRKEMGDDRTAPYVLAPRELELWEGKTPLIHVTMDNDYGKELETMTIIEDTFGNRAILGIDVSYEEAYRRVIETFVFIAIAILLLFGVLLLILHFIIRKTVSVPAKQISRHMTDFITDGSRSQDKLKVNGKDEFAMIARAFNKMTDDIDRYVSDIEQLNREQSQRKAELDIAAKIQIGLLPKVRFPGRGHEIQALINPAREVGGDLYDYQRIDSDRTLVAVADVSGKGISASMFVSVTLILIRQYAKMNLSPAEILKMTNESLARHNPETLFVTAFLGIYDSRTNQFTYSNAGHNLPYIIRGEELIKLDKASGLLLGLFEDGVYEQETVTLRNGDVLYLYTDGVNEATNTEKELFGYERLEALLGTLGRSGEKNIIEKVRESLNGFTAGAEQSDDITMLTLAVNGAECLNLAFDVREFPKIRDMIFAASLTDEDKRTLCLAAEELFVNICSYAFNGNAPENERIRFSLSVSDKVVMRFEDNGVRYNPLENVTTMDEYDMDNSIGGLGKLISFGITDGADYEYYENTNILTIIKKINNKDTEKGE